MYNRRYAILYTHTHTHTHIETSIAVDDWTDRWQWERAKATSVVVDAGRPRVDAGEHREPHQETGDAGVTRRVAGLATDGRAVRHDAQLREAAVATHLHQGAAAVALITKNAEPTVSAHLFIPSDTKWFGERRPETMS